jgi:cobalamin biosynthesis protein CobT
MGGKYMKNPFPNAMEMASKALVQDPNLRFVYRKLPPGMAAGYMFPPANLVLLPKVDVTSFDRDQQRKFTANTYHELRHHALSQKEQIERSSEKTKENPNGEGNAVVQILANIIEDARIEICPLHIFRGGKQDLTEDRIEEFKELVTKADKIQPGFSHSAWIEDRWGYLMMNIVFETQRYGELPVHPSMKKYWDIAKKIIHDGRFDKACEMGREGHKVSVDLAFEIINKWQEERDEEYEDLHNRTKERNNESSDSDNNGEGSSAPGNDSQSSGPSGEPREGDPSDNSSDHAGNSSGNNNDFGEKDKDSGGETKQSDGKSGGNSDSDPRTPRGDQEDSESDNGRGDGQDNGDGSPTNSSNSEPNDDERDKQPRPSNDGHPSDGQKNGELTEEEELARPKSILEEYKKDNKGGLQNDPNARGKEVAEMGEEGDAKDFAPNWWADTDKRDPHGDYYTNTPDGKGDVYVPYLAEDLEIVAQPYPNEFNTIQQQIASRVQHLRTELSKVLRMAAMCRTERFQKRGAIDPTAFYRVPQGGKHIKKRISPRIKLNAAVTLLIDLSGSMCGEKAALATKIATLFGEALVTIPEIPYEIRGYNSSPLVDRRFYYSTEGLDLPEGSTRKERINHWVFKRFTENWRSVRFRMGACARSMVNDFATTGGATGGCNVDHENLIYAAHHLAARPEQRKIMIVLCDGAPSGYNGTYGGLLETELVKAVQRVRAAGIKLFCFGMMADRVRMFYKPDVEIVHSLDDLDQKALKKLAEYLLKQ